MKQEIKKKKSLKIVRKTLELLLAHATTEKDFKVLDYTINDYLKQGYRVKHFQDKYNEKYERWKQTNG